jgi:uncharacterized protein (TIGR00730 family)
VPQDESKLPPFASTPSEELLLGVGEDVPLTAQDDPERIAAITAEFKMGFEALAGVQRAVSIFGSARTPATDPDYIRARAIAAELGRNGYAVITGGGPGMMEAANRGAQDVGATSIGCNIRLPHEQDPNPYQDICLTFDHFYVRKVMFVRYAQAFVVMPGGFGTMDELFEALTLAQTATIKHYPVALVGKEYWGGLIDWLRARMLKDGNIGEQDLSLINICETPEDVLELVGAEREMLRSLTAW